MADRKVSVLHPKGRKEPGAQNKRADGFVEALYRDHWAVLCRRLRRIYGDGPPEPEDLAQTAFAKVIEQYNRDDLEHAGALLFRIAVNSGLDAARKNVRTRKLIHDEFAYLEGGKVEEITPSDVYQSREQLKRLGEALDRLPVAQREAVVRSRLKGETYDQISAKTGRSPASISRHLAAAMKSLSAALSDDEDGSGGQ